jgi:excisionase family DNA binding protein
MLNKEMTREIVTVKDLAKYLHCHQSTIYRLVKRGEIPGFRLGGGWRFKIDEIDRWCRRTAVDRGSSSRSAHAAL